MLELTDRCQRGHLLPKDPARPGCHACVKLRVAEYRKDPEYRRRASEASRRYEVKRRAARQLAVSPRTA